MCDPNDLNVCCPLTSLESIMNWEPPKNNWAKYSTVLYERSQHCYLPSTDCCNVSKQKFHQKDTPKTLFCHDMKGGYLEDKFVEGCDKSEAYRFFHWSGIDIFVYFSHAFVTIPPLSWINSGHLHGVPVLGTLITEWESGEALWKEILNDEVKTATFCQKLSEICDFYSFDGFLLNVENKLNPEETEKLINCVKMLKRLLEKVKKGSLIIWYDAITSPTGELKHQNKLNSSNKAFFDACDGIFLNYKWKEKDLMESVKNAEDRKTDVFVGVDVWGRGCHGGGGFNTNEAMVMARNYNLSVALFGPAWVHEAQTPTDPFVVRDLLFWKIISPHLFLHGPAHLPFYTSFCQGYGQNSFEHGILISDKSWYNLSEQRYQPSDLCGYQGCDEHFCLVYYDQESYKGGGCLLIKNYPYTTKLNTPHRHRLFVCEFNVIGKLKVRTLIKSLNEDQKCNLAIILSLDEQNGPSREILLEDTFLDGEDDYPTEQIVDLVPTRPFSIRENNSWIFKEFDISITKKSIITQISCIVRTEGPILLGEFGLKVISDDFTV